MTRAATWSSRVAGGRARRRAFVDACEQQHLVDQSRCPVASLDHVVERDGSRRGITGVASHLRLGANCRDRRSQFVRGVRCEAPLGLHRFRDAREQRIQPLDQWLDLDGGTDVGQRVQVARSAAIDLDAESARAAARRLPTINQTSTPSNGTPKSRAGRPLSV